MFNVEVEYRGKPIKENEETGGMIDKIDKYIIRDEEHDRNHINAMRKELTKIFKKYESIFSIRFYV